MQKEIDKRIKEFYSKINENNNEELNKKLQNQYQIQKNKVIDYNFDEVNKEYIKQYGRFLREQQNFDGLRKYNYKLTSKLKRLKHSLLHIPELETPRIYKINDKSRKLQNKRSQILSKNNIHSAENLEELSKVSRLMIEKDSEELKIMKEYERKMELVKNRLAKYDLEDTNLGILGEIERFLQYGEEYSVEEDSEERDQLKKISKVDKLMEGRSKEKVRNRVGQHKKGGWLKVKG